MNVYLFKMISGEDVVAKVVSEPEETDVIKTWVIDDPVKFSIVNFPIQQQGPNGPQVAMQSIPVPTPFIFSEVKELPVKDEHVLFVDKNIPGDLEKQYLEMTSGIDLSTQGVKV